ncbi:hypothetical protein A3D11_01140 [Candidatus Peribacteria bacterium RIFCSPHIGHO2_02_FULL_49_16]|nr:MAG: hypothetical protein A2880_02870 [Candidatus Peribacteria bacterium RIFCSPHIGHO2_01_FULL_49_38]OGJ58726.1 MAG: hypothetical protein A3D11_01140 [Candidatus Peribacteria bacterium RIFCSPHIGHO2_02_FULL_49_16]
MLKIEKGTKYAVVYTKAFLRDFRRLDKSDRYDLQKLHTIIQQLADGEILDASPRHHRLHGDMQGFFECHIQGDWLLVYERREKELILVAQRTGTHSALFG